VTSSSVLCDFSSSSCLLLYLSVSVTMSEHHELSSSSSSSSVVETRHRQVTDHSVESLLHSSSSSVDESLITRSMMFSHSFCQPHVAAAAAADDDDPGMLPSFQPADVTDCAMNVRLEHKDLWDKFTSLGTEMVITKSGR